MVYCYFDCPPGAPIAPERGFRARQLEIRGIGSYCNCRLLCCSACSAVRWKEAAMIGSRSVVKSILN